MRRDRVVGGVTRVGAQTTPALTPQDYMEIQQLYARYYHTYDTQDRDAWVALFTDDGRFNNVTGREALRRVIPSIPGGSPLRHWQSNLLLTPVPGGIQGKVYVIQYDVRANPITPVSYSRYDDLLVKTAAGWRFKEKIRSTDTTFSPAPAAASPPGR